MDAIHILIVIKRKTWYIANTGNCSRLGTREGAKQDEFIPPRS